MASWKNPIPGIRNVDSFTLRRIFESIEKWTGTLPTTATPTAHASTHASGAADAITVSPSQVTGTAVVTADSRLSDARTPTSHLASHRAGGSDAITGYDIGVVPIPWTAGHYRRYPWSTAVAGSLVMVLNRAYATAIYVPRNASIDRVGLSVTAVGTTGSVVRLGLYSHSVDRPGTLISEAGTVDTATSTGMKELTVAWSNLTAGIYWIVAVAQVAVPTVTTVGNNYLGGWGPFNLGLDPIPDRWQVYQTAAMSGALTSSFTTNTAIGGPAIFVRCA
jgi:hypothetical protein